MEEKSNKNLGFIIISWVLVVLIIVLAGYILIDKNIISFKDNKIGVSDSENIGVDIEDREEKISINNSVIKTMFESAHGYSIGPWEPIFAAGGYDIKTADTDFKFKLSFKQWEKEVKTYDTTQNGLYYEVSEEAVKNGYEKLIGPNTYKNIAQIKTECETYTYDATNKVYRADVGGCGGVAVFDVYEKIISATRYSDRIEIVSAVFYEEENSLYKDYTKTSRLTGNTWQDISNTEENVLKIKELKDQYIESNKDNLEQYRYIFKVAEDGFYYIDQVKRTKS